MAEDGKTRIEKFDGQDFGWWKMQIEDLLCQKDLDQALTRIKPEKMEDAEWAALDRKAIAVIRFTLAKNVAFNIVKETTACGLMKALSNMYEKPSASNKVFLIRQLVNTRMRESMSVTSHINEFNTIISRLLSMDIKFEDEVQAYFYYPRCRKVGQEPSLPLVVPSEPLNSPLRAYVTSS